MRTLILKMVAPIPVGHRIRATPHTSQVGRLTALLTGPNPGGYVITDEDTGIEYSPGRLWQYKVVKGELVYLSKVEKSVHAGATIQGTVTACRVISTIGNAGNHSITTQITIQEDPDAPAGSNPATGQA